MRDTQTIQRSKAAENERVNRKIGSETYAKFEKSCHINKNAFLYKIVCAEKMLPTKTRAHIHTHTD